MRNNDFRKTILVAKNFIKIHNKYFAQTMKVVCCLATAEFALIHLLQHLIIRGNRNSKTRTRHQFSQQLQTTSCVSEIPYL